MPFNLLLLPLIAGFIAISRIHLFRYSTSQLQKEQLLLAASLTGIAFLVVSRALCWLVDLVVGHSLASDLHATAPFDFVGTSLGTIVLAYLAVVIVNALIPENLAGFRHYHAGEFNQLETLLLQSAIGVAPIGRKYGAIYLARKQLSRTIFLGARIFFRRRRRGSSFHPRLPLVVARWGKRRRIFPASDPKLLMLSMKDGKVYVGYVDALPPAVTSRLEYVRLLPLWSGYRDSTTKRVFRTTSYVSALKEASDPLIFLKVFPCEEIGVASLFEEAAFELTDDNQNDPPSAPKRLDPASKE